MNAESEHESRPGHGQVSPELPPRTAAAALIVVAQQLSGWQLSGTPGAVPMERPALQHTEEFLAIFYQECAGPLIAQVSSEVGRRRDHHWG